MRVAVVQFEARERRAFRRWSVLLAAFFLAAAGSAARGSGAQGEVTLELVSEVKAVRPGVPFTVALRIVHAPGWHTYWSNPGIVGVPTSLEWKLPEGFSAGSIQWPQPEVVKMGVVNAYGYEKDTFLLVDITPPETFGGAVVELRARAVYMACATTCHPGFLDLEITLPVAKAGVREPDWDARWRANFEATRASFPEGLAGWKCRVERKGERIVLRLDPDPGERKPNLDVRRAYFFSTDDQVDSDAPQTVRPTDDGGIMLELVPAFYAPKNPKLFRGILYSADGWLEEAPVKAMTIEASWPGKARGDP